MTTCFRFFWCFTIMIGLFEMGQSGGVSIARAENPQPEAITQLEEGEVEEELLLVEQVETEKLMIEALKTSTTAQEAPAIVTVLPASDIIAMGHRTVAEAVADIPSFLTTEIYYGFMRSATNRGVHVGTLVLHNTVDLYDTTGGAHPMGENLPLESLKSIEVVSGPGGVLWGANSFVGVINMVSKTGDDLQGVEASAGYGTGRGRPDRFRSYVMGGGRLLDNQLKLFAHLSYETWNHGELWYPSNYIMRPTAPQPLGPAWATGPTTLDARQSHMMVFDGNAQLGPMSLYWHVPWGLQYRSGSWAGNVVHESLEEDSLDCSDPANKNVCLGRVDAARKSRISRWRVYNQYGMLRYRDTLLDGKLGLEARGYYVYYARAMAPYMSLPPSEVLLGGVTVDQEYSGHRATLNFDADAQLPGGHRLLVGADVAYDFMAESRADFLTLDETLVRLPVYPACPPNAGGKTCPIVINYESNRFTAGIFVDWQKRFFNQVVLEAGARLTGSEGKRALDPVVLFSGAAVWSPTPDLNLKVNYADGYRPPPFSRTDSNGEGINWGGNPELLVERSHAIQGEINARLLRGYRTLRALNLRADYAHTWIYDQINAVNGQHQNQEGRGIHSAELYADLRLKRSHWMSFGYTFMDIADELSGKLRSMPNQWISLRGLFNLWNRQLFISTNLSVYGSLDDFNRYAGRSAGTVAIGNLDEGGNIQRDPVYISQSSDMVVDRVRPYPLWNAGLRFLLPQHGWRFDLDAYNILDADGYFGEGWMDLNAFLEMVPNPRYGFSFFARAQYSY